MAKEEEILDKIVELDSSDLSIDLFNQVIMFINELYIEMFNKKISKKNYDKYKNRLIDMIVSKIMDSVMCSLINATKLATYIVTRQNGTVIKEITFVEDGIFSIEFDEVNKSNKVVNVDQNNDGGYNEINSPRFNGFMSYAQIASRRSKNTVLENQINRIIHECNIINNDIISDLNGGLSYTNEGIRIFINRTSTDINDALDSNSPLSILVILLTDRKIFICYEINITYDKKHQRHWESNLLPAQSANLSDMLTYDNFEDLAYDLN